MAEPTRLPTERTLRWRRVLLDTADGRRVLAELGRELGAVTYQDTEDPHSLVKQNLWKMILGRLGILNARSLEQCLELVNALASIPPVEEEIADQEEEGKSS